MAALNIRWTNVKHALMEPTSTQRFSSTVDSDHILLLVLRGWHIQRDVTDRDHRAPLTAGYNTAGGLSLCCRGCGVNSSLPPPFTQLQFTVSIYQINRIISFVCLFKATGSVNGSSASAQSLMLVCLYLYRSVAPMTVKLFEKPWIPCSICLNNTKPPRSCLKSGAAVPSLYTLPLLQQCPNNDVSGALPVSFISVGQFHSPPEGGGVHGDISSCVLLYYRADRYWPLLGIYL